MHHVQTQIDIDAPAPLVWDILADFGQYRRWNPLIRGVLGHARAGNRIEIRLRSARYGEFSFRATVMQVSEPCELRWHTGWTLPGMFRSERRFRIEPLPQGGVRFHHDERAHGLMIPLLVRRRRLRDPAGFDAMNTALKRRAERACSTACVHPN